MTSINAQNERIKRRYIHYLKEARGLSDTTVNQALYAIAAFEKWSGYKDFKCFRAEDAVGFRKHLLARGGKRAAELSSRATVHSTLTQLKQLFRWLPLQPGYRKALNAGDADYFSLSLRDVRIANTRFEKPTPSLEQVQHVVRSMPVDTDIQKRDQALVALALLTGIRVKALVTLKLKHVRPDGLGIDQDAREVGTKFGKSFPSFFFPVGDDIRQAFADYVQHLRTSLRFTSSDPLFPSTRQGVEASSYLAVTGLTREHWKTTDPVRDVFKRAFAGAGEPYFSPHSLRRTLAQLGQQVCQTPEQMKAWSQNLGHTEVLTTFTSYGTVPVVRQADIIRTLAPGTRPQSVGAGDIERMIKSLYDVIQNRNEEG